MVFFLFSLISGTSHAMNFGTDIGSEALWGVVDFELAYGTRWRIQDRDSALISPGNGGDRSNRNGNIDDGNLNYDRGRAVANMVRGTADLTLQWSNFGAFVRGYAFYDYANQREDRARTDLGSDAREQVGQGAGILEAYISMRFAPQGMPLQFRVGQQLVNWGESRFFPSSGVNVANPLNVPRAQQPIGEPADLAMPVGMFWGSLQLNPILAVEAYYQYEWQATVLPARGTYLSTDDAYSPCGSFLQAGPFSDQGTNVDAFFGLPPGTLGYVPDWYQVPRASTKNARDQGQFGISLRMLIPKLNDSGLALFFANYHSKTPNGFWISPPTETYVDYSLQGIAAQREALIGAGVAPESATAAAGTIRQGEFFNQSRVGTLYAEDIRMLGISFNTTSMATGTALFGEFSYHFDAPMPVVPNQLFNEVLPGSTPEAPFPPVNLAQISEEEISTDYANATINFVEELDKSFLALGATLLFGPTLGATSFSVTGEIGWLHVYDFPDKDELLIQTPGLVITQFSPDSLFADADSLGYRLTGVLSYNSVFGAFNLRPRLSFAHDVHGNSPAGAGPFREGAKSLNVGINIDYLQSLRFDVAYTTFWGAGEYNLVNDRDYINFSARYSF
jgi:hypothetical protein